MAVAPSGCRPHALLSDVTSEGTLEARAKLVLDAAESLGVTQFRIQPADVVRGNEKVRRGKGKGKGGRCP